MSTMQRLRGPLKILTQQKNLTLSQQAWCCSSLQAHVKFPALKFDPVPSEQFLHDDSGRKMDANTCSNTLTLPVSSKYLDYNLFQEEFTSCILDSPEFGNM